MTYQEFITKSVEALKEATVETLKEAAAKVNNDLSIDGVVLDGILEALEQKVTEEEFVSFCETL